MAMINECHSPSVKQKLKTTICCFPCHETTSNLFGSSDDSSRRTPRSPYAWLKSTAQELEIWEKYRSLIGKRGKNRRRYNSADFRYDATSYSLNFEDDPFNNYRDIDDFPLNNFTSRLPAIPESLSGEHVDTTTRTVLIAWT